ncbi:hypothetical protein E2C01_054646 [Portunus trituberculatus]|uniref:Endonuclease/exonuclease/phosphatase domain-containing protein n=1 Tax=Portunus trituberculatus TaxID=210409 RepID=A0A5B7GVK1_PORTR|nr:hypothetical protein [Portunus trituberculatus]
MEVMGNAGSWNELFQLTMVNTLDQCVEESTRFRGAEKPSLLDLVFTKKPESPPSKQYLSPMGRSDHVTLVLEMQEEDVIGYREE